MEDVMLREQTATRTISALLQSFGGRLKMGRTRAEPVMSDFKWRHFECEIILWAVRWYCRYGISYRDLEQMMGSGVTRDRRVGGSMRLT